MKKTTITITKELHKRARQYALDNETSVSELVRESLAARLDNSQVRFLAYTSTLGGVLSAVVIDDLTKSECFRQEMRPGQSRHDAENLACIEAGRLEAQNEHA